MDQEGFLAVGGFDVGFGDAGQEIEHSITWEGSVSVSSEQSVGNTHASSRKAFNILSISASWKRVSR
jgi:hypothetical protein